MFGLRTNLLKNGRPDPAWVRLIEAFPDRFLLGTDKVIVLLEK